jgi:hypothetical protein
LQSCWRPGSTSLLPLWTTTNPGIRHGRRAEIVLLANGRDFTNPDEDLVKQLPANNQVLALPCSNGETSWRQREGRRTGRSGNMTQLEGGKNLIYPTVHIKQVTIHSSIHQIMRVSSQTAAFRRDLHICGLRSTIRAMNQKVNFWSTSEASLNKLNFFKKN